MSVAVPPPWRNKNVANLDLQKYCCIPESGNILPSALVNNCNFPFIIFLAFHFLLQEAPRSSKPYKAFINLIKPLGHVNLIVSLPSEAGLEKTNTDLFF